MMIAPLFCWRPFSTYLVPDTALSQIPRKKRKERKAAVHLTGGRTAAPSVSGPRTIFPIGTKNRRTASDIRASRFDEKRSLRRWGKQSGFCHSADRRQKALCFAVCADGKRRKASKLGAKHTQSIHGLPLTVQNSDRRQVPQISMPETVRLQWQTEWPLLV
jgi:hypothetical protein